MKLVIFLLFAIGLYSYCVQKNPKVYKPAAQALVMRNQNRISSSEKLINALASKVEPYIHIDPIKRSKLISDLQSINIFISPELYQARTISRSALFSAPSVVLAVFSPFMLIMTVFIAWQNIQSSSKKLKAQIQERKNKIERELPQFASTIRQSLNTSRDIVTMLEGYRKICGTALSHEIEITLNDIKTGNTERALKALDGRVSSSKFSQMIRGLIGINRGDDQKVYFDVLTIEYQKAQDEEVKKELLLRPAKLNKYIGALFACLFALTLLAIGMVISSQLSLMF